jgi:hypothetical protein
MTETNSSFKMNIYDLEEMLNEYPVTVCTADKIQIRRGEFVISNTGTSEGSGKHEVVDQTSFLIHWVNDPVSIMFTLGNR